MHHYASLLALLSMSYCEEKADIGLSLPRAEKHGNNSELLSEAFCSDVDLVVIILVAYLCIVHVMRDIRDLSEGKQLRA